MTTKALYVGINDYSPAGRGGPDLRGPVNDVELMAITLQTLGIVQPIPSNVKILTDGQATKGNILDAVRWLVNGAKKGDLLIFYYSGHGSLVPDISGDELDHFDETICPHDYATQGMIRDDDLNEIFAGLPGDAFVTLEAILDSCHSGTSTRVPEVVPRYIQPPLDLGYFVLANPALPVVRLLRSGLPREAGRASRYGTINAGMMEVREANINHVLWAACRDNQTASETELDGRWHGVFTYALCKVLRTPGPLPKRTQIDSMVTQELKRMNYQQEPQTEGKRTFLDASIFTSGVA